MSNKEKLRKAGLRPTKQRMIIADILLDGINRHFTAENLQNEINSSGNSMSIATIYNCLKKFRNCGLELENDFSSGRQCVIKHAF